MHHQAHGYFGLLGIGNIGNKVLSNPLVVSALQNFSNNLQEVQNFDVRVGSDMIAKAIEFSITKTSLKKSSLCCGEYEWANDGVLIRNYGPTMLYLLLKSSTWIQGLVFLT